MFIHKNTMLIILNQHYPYLHIFRSLTERVSKSISFISHSHSVFFPNLVLLSLKVIFHIIKKYCLVKKHIDVFDLKG